MTERWQWQRGTRLEIRELTPAAYKHVRKLIWRAPRTLEKFRQYWGGHEKLFYAKHYQPYVQRVGVFLKRASSCGAGTGAGRDA